MAETLRLKYKRFDFGVAEMLLVEGEKRKTSVYRRCIDKRIAKQNT